MGKPGRPLKLGTELDKLVIERVKMIRENGGVISRATVQSIGKAVLTVKDPKSLAANGGTITLGEGWAKSLLQRMGYSKRAATTGKLTLPTG